MPDRKKLLFLTLRVFSSTGGIEKVCRVFSRSLQDLSQQHPEFRFQVLSLYDHPRQHDTRYLPADRFSGFAESKWRFLLAAIRESTGADFIVASHVNLLPVLAIVKKFSPRSRILLFAHGIELWDSLSARRLRMLQHCHQILAVSGYTADVIKERHALSKEQVRVFPNCIDPFLTRHQQGKSEQLLQRYGLSQDHFVLLTLTRLSSKEFYKGYDLVIRNLNQIALEYPACRYLIIGKYDEVEKERLDQLIRENGLERRVIFTGYIPDEELEAHYHLADLFVMPSKKEGFGIVFVEAMYYGLPVIAGNKDGSTEALLHGKLGILIDPDSDEELREAIMRIIKDRNRFIPNDRLLANHFGYVQYQNRVEALLFSESYS